ncbi:putative aldo-keto reductase [Auriculariales sp. MPI-PUGE-AT-0066]|nr:putative aldo-keto reductase [Auriculariales sp. MPI-PUGE-AT-0066]
MAFPTRSLGRNGPKVSSIGLGLLGMSIFYGFPPSDEQMFEALDRAIEEGCTFWDSSDFYGDNSERIQKYFAARPGAREKVFFATKVSGWWNADGSFGMSNEPSSTLREATDKVLKRLGLPYVDLLYLHRADPKVPIEHSVGALADLVKAGKVGAIGLSEVEYSAFSLDIEVNGVLAACRDLGIAVVAYSPVSRGFLTGEIKTTKDFPPNDLRAMMPRFDEDNFPKNLKVVEKFAEGAEKRGVTATQLALAWLLAQGEDIIPIPGDPGEDKEIRDILSTISGSRYPDVFASGLYVDTAEL